MTARRRAYSDGLSSSVTAVRRTEEAAKIHLSSIHFRAAGHSTFRANKPALPRRLISWSLFQASVHSAERRGHARLDDELRREDPGRKLAVGRDGARLGVPRDLAVENSASVDTAFEAQTHLRDLREGDLEVGRDLDVLAVGRGTLEPVAEQLLRVACTIATFSGRPCARLRGPLTLVDG
jgi:hypothetical protein